MDSRQWERVREFTLDLMHSLLPCRDFFLPRQLAKLLDIHSSTTEKCVLLLHCTTERFSLPSQEEWRERERRTIGKKSGKLIFPLLPIPLFLLRRYALFLPRSSTLLPSHQTSTPHHYSLLSEGAQQQLIGKFGHNIGMAKFGQYEKSSAISMAAAGAAAKRIKDLEKRTNLLLMSDHSAYGAWVGAQSFPVSPRIVGSKRMAAAAAEKELTLFSDPVFFSLF